MGETSNEAAKDFAGEQDGFERLWTPHRMVYIGGESKPSDDGEHTCPFCLGPRRDDETSLIVRRGRECFAILNLYPYSPGHVLVCPYRHVSDYTELNAAETEELAIMTQQAMTVIRGVSNPHGFNLGMNQGAVAGAGIAAHLHQHVVPRWAGDSNFLPIIARTKPVPQLLSDTRQLVADAWRKEFPSAADGEPQ